MKHTNTSFYIGLLLCALVLLNVGLWIYTATSGDITFEQARQTYLGYFPGFLQNATLLTLLDVGLCTLSLFLLIRPGELVDRLTSALRVPAIGANTVLIAWNVFSLM